MKIDEFITQLEACSACRFRNPNIKPLVPTGSSSSARIMFVGENPSWADDQGAPFSQTTISGRALREHYLKQLGLLESEVWITDLFKCRYPKIVYRDKLRNEVLIQKVACECATRWLVRELELVQPSILVTLSDKEVYKRLRSCFEWKTPKLFEDAVGKPHEVQIGEHNVTIFPMVHPDIARPIGDGDNRKSKARTKWAPLHRDVHVPALKALIAAVG